MSEVPPKPSFRLTRPGGDVDPGRVFNVPGVVMMIAVVTCVLFVLLVLAPTRIAQYAEFAAAVSPQRIALGVRANGGFMRYFSPLIAHMFVHANLPHLLFNALWLLAVGSPIARRMGAEYALKSFNAFYAASLFLTFYLLCGVAGALTFVGMHLNEVTFLVGASGGVSGLLGGLVRFAFNRTSILGPEHGRLSALLSPSVITWSIMIVVMNVAVGITGGPLTGGAQIAWEAHLGGYFFGLLSYPFFERLARGTR